MAPSAPQPTATIALLPAVPILRIFDEGRARAFYVDWLGFAVTFEHRFAPHLPLYMGIQRDGLVLHLSGHHGDGSPGGAVFLPLRGLRALLEELRAKPGAPLNPAIEDQPWGLTMDLLDPFGTQLRFCQPHDPGTGQGGA